MSNPATHTATESNASLAVANMAGAVPMWSVGKGATAVVTGFNCISDVYLQRMREIGIDVGAEIKCLNRPPFSAPRQYQICDGVFSLDKEIASSILVSAI